MQPEARKIDTRRIEAVDPAMAAIYARMSPTQRLEVACKMQAFAKEMVEAQIRATQPNLDETSLRQELVWRMLGVRL